MVPNLIFSISSMLPDTLILAFSSKYFLKCQAQLKWGNLFELSDFIYALSIGIVPMYFEHKLRSCA